MMKGAQLKNKFKNQNKNYFKKLTISIYNFKKNIN
jgi:hypothetical protein